MEFDKEHHRISSVDLPIYGRDLSVGKGRREPVAQPVLLPVFGLKTGSDAFMAVVEEGEALGTIHAERAGSNSSYNAVGTTFTLRAQEQHGSSRRGYRRRRGGGAPAAALCWAADGGLPVPARRGSGLCRHGAGLPPHARGGAGLSEGRRHGAHTVCGNGGGGAKQQKCAGCQLSGRDGADHLRPVGGHGRGNWRRRRAGR